MQKLLSQDQVAFYRDRGYHFPVDVLSADEVADFRRKLEEYEAASGGPIKGEMRHRSHVLFTWINQMVRHPRILDAVEDLLGPNILCWNTSFFIKEAHDPGFVSWHQDATYWGLSSSDVATAWIAFSPANKISGCMKFIDGTHRQQVAHADTFDQNNLLTRGQEIAVEVDEARAVHVELKPGQASLHHVLLFHGSEPNQSNDRRIGLGCATSRRISSRRWAPRIGRRWCVARMITATSNLNMCPSATLSPKRWRFTGWCRKNRCACSIAAPGKAPIEREVPIVIARSEATKQSSSCLSLWIASLRSQ
jgi:ectoine hydroxylase-related dioxygenase (phytanoyl-CoA dioxygenase family)